MSPDHLPKDTLNKIHTEIFEHIKISGVYDDVRVNLINPIWSDPKFKDVIAKFESECERFCDDVDLNLNRNSLREKLINKIDNYSTTGRLLKAHIERLLKERNDEIRSRYYEHANEFLKKFLPEFKKTEEPALETTQEITPEPIKQEPNVTQDVKSESKEHTKRQDQPVGSDEYQDVEMDVDMDIDSTPDELSGGWQDDDEDIERPVYSPIEAIKEEINQDGEVELKDKEKEEPSEEGQNGQHIEEGEKAKPEQEEQIDVRQVKMELKEVTETTQEELQIPLPPEDDYRPNTDDDKSSPDDDDELNADDDIDKLTFSPVSSVNTDDLNDFDNSIKLSDDEATIVGKPKNSKVPIQVIQGSINDLQTSKPSGGKRVTRTRKSNPRYDNKDFKLL